MNLQEIILPGEGGNNFEARLYINRDPHDRSGVVTQSHPAMEISVPQNGSGKYNIGGKEIPFKKGDIIIIRSNEPHYMSEIDEQDGVVFLGIHCYPTTFWSAGNTDSAGTMLRYFSLKNPDFRHRLPAGNPYTQQVRQLVEDIQREFEERGREHALKVKLDILSILIAVMRCHPADEHIMPACSSEQLHHVNEALKYIDTHFSEQLTLQQLAETVHLSPSHFSHLFHGTTGFSLWDYVISKRIDAAKKLLIESDSNIMDIATECGFNNATHFNKCFKKLTGMTPNEFRKS